jgi:hypothetical protein
MHFFTLGFPNPRPASKPRSRPVPFPTLFLQRDTLAEPLFVQVEYLIAIILCQLQLLQA